METKLFKTNAKCGGCVADIGSELDKFLATDQWRIDLSTPDRLLYVTADVPDERIIAAVEQAGFKAERK